MGNKKYTKGTVIGKYKLGGSGRWTNYQIALPAEELELLNYALNRGYATLENDAPRGGKWGVHFLVKRYFTTNSLTKKMLAERKAIDDLCSKVLESKRIRAFDTVSEVGSFHVNGVYYSNLSCSGNNTVEICECNPKEFYAAELLTRRQVFQKDKPITIVKFDTLQTLKIANVDRNLSDGEVTAENVLGFVIWSNRMKIFVPIGAKSVVSCGEEKRG